MADWSGLYLQEVMRHPDSFRARIFEKIAKIAESRRVNRTGYWPEVIILYSQARA